MKANELRIGNYVNWEDGVEKDIVQITCVSIDEEICCESKSNIYITTYDFIKPLSLSEEWLLKFGFDKRGHFFETSKNTWIILSNEKDHFVPMFLKKPRLKYVHQLQNLYFALTGEELTLVNQKTEQ